MNRLDIAVDRAMGTEQPEQFLLAYHLGLHAAQRDVNTASYLQGLIAHDNAPAAAGFLEGIAAANANAGMPTESDGPFWRRNLLRGKQVAA
jgi:hypothetical protein